VHGDAANVTVALLDLAGVQACPDLQADAAQLVSEIGRASDGPAGAVEGGQDATTGRVDQPPVKLLDESAGQLVVDV
jgi:hypothetical protein